jgi:uncharacterized protein
MVGIMELDKLLSSMEPELLENDYVFCTVPGSLKDYIPLNPIASFVEQEGLTLILDRQAAESAGIDFEGTFRQITLTVHSSLEAVGLTAAISAKLTEYGISANVVAAYFHDHIFVPADKADAAMSALQEFTQK